MPVERRDPATPAALTERFRSVRESRAEQNPEGREFAELVLSDVRYRHVLEQMRAMLAEIDSAGRIVAVSATAEMVTGFTPKQLIGQLGTYRVHPDDVPAIAKLADELQVGSRKPSTAFRYQHRNGEWIWLETASVMAFESADGSIHAVSLTRDVSDVKRAELEVRESEERYRQVAEITKDLITEIADGEVVFASPNAETVMGFSQEELTERPPYSAIHEDDRKRVQEALERAIRERKPVRIDPYRVIRPDGTESWLASRGIHYQRADGEYRFLSVNRNVTDQIRRVREHREIEEQLRRAQRLESLGILAGGIAHDFNNLLTPILGEAGLALMDLPADSSARRRLERVRDAAQRAAALTTQMLAYAGEEPLEIEPVNLSILVRDMSRLLESVAAGRTPLQYRLAPDLPAVDGDPSRLRQVVMNLVANGAEAVADRSGGVTISTATVTLDGKLPRHYAGELLGPGRYVAIVVEDTGGGMDAATRARIFDPFFSTRFAGRGLGLAAALGIVRSHRGAIGIESELGQGTQARVLLPLEGSGRR